MWFVLSLVGPVWLSTFMQDSSQPRHTEAEPTAEAQAIARSEIAEYLDVNQQRRRLLPRAALVGLLEFTLAVLAHPQPRQCHALERAASRHAWLYSSTSLILPPRGRRAD